MSDKSPETPDNEEGATAETAAPNTAASTAHKSTESADTAGEKEYGGQKGPEPTRYGDWEKNGIISDF